MKYIYKDINRLIDKLIAIKLHKDLFFHLYSIYIFLSGISALSCLYPNATTHNCKSKFLIGDFLYI